MVGLFRFDNGDKVRTLVAGFEGIVTGRTDYIHGGNRYFTTPFVDDDGNPRDGYWFEEGDLVVLEKNFLERDTPLMLSIQKGKGAVNV